MPDIKGVIMQRFAESKAKPKKAKAFSAQRVCAEV